MRRRYTTEEFLAAARRLQAAFPDCALTTDVIVGFPGETEEEFQDSLVFCQKVGFAKLHVFPYSQREGTPAAVMPGQLPKAVKEDRVLQLIALGDRLADAYRRKFVGKVEEVLFEQEDEQGAAGYTPQYMEVYAQGAKSSQLASVRLEEIRDNRFVGTMLL